MAYGQTELFIVKGGLEGLPGQPGEQGSDGASAFESWLVEQGITDTPETHDANWQAYMDAIKGAPGEDGQKGPSVFEDWCTRENKDPTDLAAWEEFIESLTAKIPGRVGEILASLSGEPIGGALLCDGATYNKADYIMLYEFLALNVPTLIVDSNTFMVPDLRGEFLRGLGIDRELGSHQDDAIRNITGEFRVFGRPTWVGAGYVKGAFELNSITNDLTTTTGSGFGAGQVIFDTSLVVPTADENRPVNTAVNYYIRYTTVTGNEVEQGPAGPAGDNAFVTWCKEHEIDPDDPAAWEDYMTAIRGNAGEDGEPGEPGVDGLSPYEEYKLQHPSASYEDWLRVVTAAFSVPLVDAVVGGPSVKIPKIHPESRKPIYRKYADLGVLNQYAWGANAAAVLVPAANFLDVDVSLIDYLVSNNSLSYSEAANNTRGAFAGLPVLRLNNATDVSNAYGMYLGLSPDTWEIVVWCSTFHRNRRLIVCLEYTLTSDAPIEFPIWTQKEGWISPPGYIGEIVATFDTEPEPGTLVCDGSLLERIDYPSLYDFIQLKIPVLIVDADNFYLPDLRGEFLRGVSADRDVGSQQGDAIRNVTGYIGYAQRFGPTADMYPATYDNNQQPGRAFSTGVSGEPRNRLGHTYLDASLIVPTADENRPVNTAVTYCIRYMNTFDPSGGGQMPIGSVEVIEDEVVIP